MKENRTELVKHVEQTTRALHAEVEKHPAKMEPG